LQEFGFIVVRSFYFIALQIPHSQSLSRQCGPKTKKFLPYHLYFCLFLILYDSRTLSNCSTSYLQYQVSVTILLCTTCFWPHVEIWIGHYSNLYIRKRPAEEFYAHRYDPFQIRKRADNPTYAKEIVKPKEELFKYHNQTNDPR
ncbi:MAG: hypothetical protein ACI9FN_002240, partial [Saprospiraceae bacterium]